MSAPFYNIPKVKEYDLVLFKSSQTQRDEDDDARTDLTGLLLLPLTLPPPSAVAGCVASGQCCAAQICINMDVEL